jgi:high frequency lysogenization protein
MQFMYSSMRSLLILNPKTIDDIYGGVRQVAFGLEEMEHFKQDVFTRQGQVLGYFINITRLARQLYKSEHTHIREAVLKGLKQARRKYMPTLSTTRDVENMEFYEHINDLYLSTISKLPQRISLFGDPQRLRVPAVKHKLRSLLMAAIRSAVLWQQYGGNMPRLIMERKQLFGETQHLLEQLKDKHLSPD